MKNLWQSIIKFMETAVSQEEKGIKKYGKSLDPLDDYDWLKMALEENVDGTKYIVAEQEKRKFIVGKIRKRTDDEEILYWLDQLEGKSGSDVRN